MGHGDSGVCGTRKASAPLVHVYFFSVTSVFALSISLVVLEAAWQSEAIETCEEGKQATMLDTTLVHAEQSPSHPCLSWVVMPWGRISAIRCGTLTVPLHGLRAGTI